VCAEGETIQSGSRVRIREQFLARPCLLNIELTTGSYDHGLLERGVTVGFGYDQPTQVVLTDHFDKAVKLIGD
jgi:hypothetical protein